MTPITSTYVEDLMLKAKCPVCSTVNAFPEVTSVEAFICNECGIGVTTNKEATE